MKKEMKIIVILLGVLILFVGAFFGIKAWNAKQEEEQEEQAEAEKIVVFEADSLTSIRYEDSTGSYESFSKEEDIWIYDADNTIPLDEDVMTQMEDSFSQIAAVKQIENPDALEAYGFTEPQFKLAVTTSEGEQKTFFIGNTAGENYYFIEDGTENVYCVAAELTGEMLWNLADYAEEEIFPYIEEEAFVKETITDVDGTETVLEAPEGDETDATASNAITALGGMYFTECVDYHLIEENRKDYGLDEKSRTKVEVVYNADEGESVLTFYIGNADEEATHYYVQLDGSQQVHTVLISTVDSILGKDTEE